MRRLRWLLRHHAAAVEADLTRFYPGIDLRDVWRRGSGLTWRRLCALVAHLPAESACARAELPAGVEPWSRTDLLLADVWQVSARSKEAHPDLRRDQRRIEAARRDTPERRRRIEDAKRRRDERQAAIDAGEIT